MKTRVVTLEGTYVRNPSTRLYEHEPEQEERLRCPLCIWVSLGIAAWAALIGVGYAIWRAAQALLA
jgi:hypothetical protein